jgi:tetratricopeptide (TPR) repeat protein
MADAPAGQTNQTSQADQAEMVRLMQSIDPLFTLGRYQDCATACQELLPLIPEVAEATDFIALVQCVHGDCLRELGQPAQALDAYAAALARAPRLLRAHVGQGRSYGALGQAEPAAAAYRRALAIDPNHAHAHNNLGNALRNLGKWDEAEAAYRRAVALKPDHLLALNNLGVVLTDMGRFAEAVDCLRAVLARDASYAVAHLNLGKALVDMGAAERAVDAYRQAAALAPDRIDAQLGLAIALYAVGDLGAAAAQADRTLAVDAGHAEARFYRGVIAAQQGDAATAERQFHSLRTAGPDHAYLLEGWDYVRRHSGPRTRLLGHSFAVLEHALASAKPDGLVLEFGVQTGTSIRFLAARAGGPVHGFDSFQGLPEAWGNQPAGFYTTYGALPEVPDNVELHVGWFADTLPGFAATHPGPVRFINVDCDLYSATATIFAQLGERIGPGSVIVFDEYLFNRHWRQDEYKAFQEAVARHGWRYEYLAFCVPSKQAAVVIL